MPDAVRDDSVLLKKCIYDLVQAESKKAVEILKKLGILGGNLGLCFYIQKSKKA